MHRPSGEAAEVVALIRARSLTMGAGFGAPFTPVSFLIQGCAKVLDAREEIDVDSSSVLTVERSVEPADYAVELCAMSGAESHVGVLGPSDRHRVSLGR